MYSRAIAGPGPVKARRRSAGFTFIEVMVVVVIIGMLAGAVTLKVRDHMSKARVNRAQSDIRVITEAVETYQVTHGRYPTSDEGLADVDVKASVDPWGNAYQYNSPGRDGQDFEVYSLGADGAPGGEDVEADIYSWQLGEGE
jgi:general secretion pathway protein G